MILKCFCCNESANPLHKVSSLLPHNYKTELNNFCGKCAPSFANPIAIPISTNCPGCGLALITYDKIKGKRFCCGLCRKAYQNTHYPKPPVKRVKKLCNHCDKSYLLKRSDSKYCSTKCRVAGNRQIKKDCSHEIKVGN